MMTTGPWPIVSQAMVVPSFEWTCDSMTFSSLYQTTSFALASELVPSEKNFSHLPFRLQGPLKGGAGITKSVPDPPFRSFITKLKPNQDGSDGHHRQIIHGQFS